MEAEHTQTHTRQNTEPGATSAHTVMSTGPLEPTVKSRDPEDLCDVHSDDVEAAGGSLGQESDHRLQKLFRGRAETCLTLGPGEKH